MRAKTDAVQGVAREAKTKRLPFASLELTGLALIARAIRLTGTQPGHLRDISVAVTRNTPNVTRHRVEYNSPSMGKFSENPLKKNQ